ncbi:xanthine dehydrogenase family Fe-S subunit [Bradyrhizobium quebecense]|uniref:SRPBCC family protein n=2 Tax=Bradyrhizobium quebecense TaxID=2748629 RepID=A0ABS3MCX1_9BRAD|nr:2Fe-2S iron-sulfur cluster-binding protein [Bradyrhizobium quebecense]UGY04627.1 2Fe-2S iron-sulfur cluster-binding protein [Bradyrhizobium quebecense]
MTQVSMTVNGGVVVADVEPRTLLADFLRGELQLTGTHLGCEQGVCGACTVVLDGRIQRSCITFAADCDGGNVTTIEGFDDDPTMQELREAFSEHHALQCGFCTPGMLTTARDIVLRLGEIDERALREELSGNLCRCTGYVGIVAAVKKVAAGKKPDVAAAVAPVVGRLDGSNSPPAPTPAINAAVTRTSAPAMAASVGESAGSTSIEERVRVAAPAEKVWSLLSDLQRVVPCVPGAEITSLNGEDLVGKVRIALGPIKVTFNGQAKVGMDPSKREGWLTGRGRDAGQGSSAEGSARWTVVADGASASLIAVVLTWKLSGPLAQFNRAGLVHDVVRRLAATFAENLEAAITGAAPPRRKTLGGLGLIWSVIKARLLSQR